MKAGNGTSADPLAVTLPKDPYRLSDLRATLKRWLTQAGVTEPDLAGIVLAAHEAAANAVEHGNSDKPIVVRARVANATVVVEVHDQGTWKPGSFNDEERGRGLILIYGLMDEVEIDSGSLGTTVRMIRLGNDS